MVRAFGALPVSRFFGDVQPAQAVSTSSAAGPDESGGTASAIVVNFTRSCCSGLSSAIGDTVAPRHGMH